MSKSNVAAEWSADVDAGTLVVRFANGQSRTFNVRALDPEMVLRLAMHGLEQKGRDSYAGAKKAIEEGKATNAVSYAVEQANRVLDNIQAGVWAERATGNGGDLARAVAEVTGKPVVEVAEALKGKSDEEKAKIKGNPKVKAILARYAAERAAAKAKAAEAGAEDGDEDEGLEELL